MKNAPKFFAPFGIGDVVRYARHTQEGDNEAEEGWLSWTIGEEHIIAKVEVLDVNTYEYSTTEGAWIPHASFDLVRKADLESVTKLVAFLDSVEEDEG